MLGVLPVIASCGAGKALRPGDPTYAAAVGSETPGGAKCTSVGDESSPLVVDWKADERGDLEVAMRQGVAVVHYDCQSLRLLADCRVEGLYGYIGMTTKEQIISLADADEAKVNLPLNGATIGASIGRGSSLNIALLMVGKRTTTFTGVEREQLTGRCDGATHFVHTATVGAFAMKTGASGEVATTASIFGVGASAGSSSTKAVANKDGDIGSCQQSDIEAKKPPGQCGAPLRIQLIAIHDKAKPVELVAQADGAASGKKKTATESASGELTCPAGSTVVQGKCAASRTSAPHQCKPDDAADCAKQCSANDAASCLYLGLMYSRGRAGLAVDKAKAASAYQRACDGNEPSGCSNLGLLYVNGQGVKQDDVKATALYERACSAGGAAGCELLGSNYEFADGGLKVDMAKAISLYRRSCDAGYPTACADLASDYENGMGVHTDMALAVTLYQRACDGGHMASCTYLGTLYRHGSQGVAVDKAKALRLTQRACSAGYARGCTSLGVMYEKGDGVAADRAKAAALYKAACSAKDAEGCMKEKSLARGR